MFGQREVPTLTTGLEGGSGNNVVALTIYQKKYEHPEEPEEWSRTRGCLLDLMEMLMRNTGRLVPVKTPNFGSALPLQIQIPRPHQPSIPFLSAKLEGRQAIVPACQSCEFFSTTNSSFDTASTRSASRFQFSRGASSRCPSAVLVGT